MPEQLPLVLEESPEESIRLNPLESSPVDAPAIVGSLCITCDELPLHFGHHDHVNEDAWDLCTHCEVSRRYHPIRVIGRLTLSAHSFELALILSTKSCKGSPLKSRTIFFPK
jgi:hypothetical protein